MTPTVPLPGHTLWLTVISVESLSGSFRPPVFPEAGQFYLGPLWSIPQNLAHTFFLVIVQWLGFVFMLWFLGFLLVNSVNSVLNQCKLLLHILSLAIGIFFVHCMLQ